MAGVVAARVAVRVSLFHCSESFSADLACLVFFPQLFRTDPVQQPLHPIIMQTLQHVTSQVSAIGAALQAVDPAILQQLKAPNPAPPPSAPAGYHEYR